MSKNTTDDATLISNYKSARQQLEARLQALREQTAHVEELLGTPPPGLPMAGAETKADGTLRIRGSAKTARREPLPAFSDFDQFSKGTLLRKVLDYIKAHPGVGASRIAKALRMKTVPVGTCLHTLKGRNVVDVTGARGSYRYYVAGSVPVDRSKSAS